MIRIPLANVPNQSLSINLDGRSYDLRFHAVQDDTGLTAYDIVRDNITLITGMLAVPDEPLIPYRYLADGNFVFVTMNSEYPDWREFGITQTLVYASQAEIAAL